MGLCATAVILSFLVIYGITELFHAISSSLNIEPSMVFVIVPIGLASCLLSVLIGLRTALFAGLFVSIVTSIMLGDSFRLVIGGMIVSCVAGYAVRKAANYRTFFMRGWLAVFLATLCANFQPIPGLDETFRNPGLTFVLSLINGLTTAMLALLLIFLIESLFNVSTDMSLILLCDYNHPLLKRLQFEAPGTYHHSLMVSTLAEQAAEAIQANPVKARVYALFHDIGKLAQPEYFTENDFGDKRKHDELTSRMSSTIIRNHVKEGVELAVKHNLRKGIRDAIEQHHGTDLVWFFYRRALEENGDSPVQEQEFRYSGPLPKEKEVALVSLADICEAASRSLQNPSPAKIESLVWELFRKRIRDRQLDDAELTFGELARIRESFVKTITTMLHGRIAYPKDEQNNDEDDLFAAAEKISAAAKTASSETHPKRS
jgi:putative nucleotidyltransferase with HDIG domain